MPLETCAPAVAGTSVRLAMTDQRKDARMIYSSRTFVILRAHPKPGNRSADPRPRIEGRSPAQLLLRARSGVRILPCDKPHRGATQTRVAGGIAQPQPVRPQPGGEPRHRNRNRNPVTRRSEE